MYSAHARLGFTLPRSGRYLTQRACNTIRGWVTAPKIKEAAHRQSQVGGFEPGLLFRAQSRLVGLGDRLTVICGQVAIMAQVGAGCARGPSGKMITAKRLMSYLTVGRLVQVNATLVSVSGASKTKRRQTACLLAFWLLAEVQIRSASGR